MRLAYFSQQGRELDEDDTVLQTVLPLVGHDEEQARAAAGPLPVLGRRRREAVDMLSGGERSRLRLLTLLVGNANFLLLDEPTNHLDVGSVEALAEALEEYTGTILLITHDRHLIDTVATRVLEIHDGQLLNHLSVDALLGGARGARRPRRPARARPADSRGTAPAAAAPADDDRHAQPRHDPEQERRRRARLRGVEADDARSREAAGRHRRRARRAARPTRTAPAPPPWPTNAAAIETRLEELYGQWEELLDEP